MSSGLWEEAAWGKWWGRGNMDGGMGTTGTEGTLRGTPGSPTPNGCRDSSRGGCSTQLPSHSSLSPVPGYVSIPSHPRGASTSTETYLQTSAWAIFLCLLRLQGHSSDLLTGKHSALESGATWWPSGVKVLRLAVAEPPHAQQQGLCGPETSAALSVCGYGSDSSRGQ